MKAEAILHPVFVMICEMCLEGKGGECHVPGCLFWMDDAPDRFLADRIVTATKLNGRPVNLPHQGEVTE